MGFAVLLPRAELPNGFATFPQLHTNIKVAMVVQVLRVV